MALRLGRRARGIARADAAGGPIPGAVAAPAGGLGRGRSYVGLFNLVSRALTLLLRLVLSFYITKALGFEQAGVYGLCLGAVSVMPSLVGWGLNYFVSREVVGLGRTDAFTLLGDRLSVTVASLALVTALALTASLLAGRPIDATDLRIGALVWLETVALDVHMSLIGMDQSMRANALVFVRTAAWVPPCIALALLVPGMRTLDTVFDCWILANVGALAMTVHMFRDLPGRALLGDNARRAVRLLGAYRFWLIYLSDLGQIGSIYLDRYVITYVLGVEQTGVYFFYWSFSNAAQTLVLTAVVQVAQPRFVDTFRRGDLAAWRAVLGQELAKAAAAGAALLVATYVAAAVLIDLVSIRRAPGGDALLLLLLAGAMCRICSDVLNLALASIGRDGAFARLNMLSCVVAVGCAYVGATHHGLVGAGWGVLAATGLMLGVRAWILGLVVRRMGEAR